MEKYVLDKLKESPYVASLHETWHDDFFACIRMENMKGGELWSICKNFGFNCKAKIAFYFIQMVKAVESIQEKGIVHRDIKPENIMLTEDKKKLKLIDFGTAWDLHNPDMKGAGNGSTGRKVFDHFVGTPHYMPQELVRNKGSFLTTDIYSLGCILYQMISGYQPFLGASEYLIFQQSIDGELKFYDFFDEHAISLITHMMHKDYTQRPTTKQILESDYLKGWEENLAELANSIDSDFKQYMTSDERTLNLIRTKVISKKAECDEFNSKIQIPDIEGEISAEKQEARNIEVEEKKMKLTTDEITQIINEVIDGYNPQSEHFELRVKMLKRQMKHLAAIKTFEHFY